MKQFLKALAGAVFIFFLLTCVAIAQARHLALDSLQRQLSAASSDSLRVRILLRMATISWQNAYNEEALGYAQKALNEASKLNNEHMQADAHRLIGIAYTNKGEYDKALIHYQLAQSIYASLPKVDTLNLARTLNNIGLLYSYQGYTFVSLQYFQRSLYLRNLIKDRIGISNSITNIGRIKSNIGDQDSARYYFRQAYELRKKEGDVYATTASLADIAESFRKSGNTDSALYYYERAYELSSAHRVHYNASLVLSSMSNIYANMGQYEKALRYARGADSLAQNESNWQRVRSYNSLAQAYMGLGKLSQARAALSQARKLGNISQARLELVNTYRLHYKLDSTAGNYKDALSWLIRHEALKDSIATTNRINQTLELQYMQEINEKQEAMVQLRNERQLKALQMQAQALSRKITFIVIGVLVLAMAVIVFVWRQTRKQNRELANRQLLIEKMNAELAQSNEAYQQKAAELEQTVFLLKKTNEELTALNREKDGLLGVMAHDLKTPLEGIKGLAEVIRMKQNLDEDQLECLRLIELSVERGTSLIADILFINAYEEGQIKPDFKQVGLQQMLLPYIQTYVTRAAKKQIDFEWTININQPIVTDPKLLVRIVDSLLSNAIKFTFGGYKVCFYAGIEQERLVIRVSDQGQGIAIDEQKLLFTKFKRLSANPTANESSTGLGLAIVNQIVEDLKGTIQVQSAKGVGTTFTVYLPLQPVQALTV